MSRGMTQYELLALPVAVSLDDANRALSIGRSFGYQLVKTGEYPVTVLRLGNAYRVRRSDLLSLLGVTEAQPRIPRAPVAPESA